MGISPFSAILYSMGKKTTIYDIAKYLSISPASVSYVINGVDKVSDETRERVLAVIKEMGYMRANSAVSLSRGKSNTVCLILPGKDISMAFSQNTFYGEFISVLSKELQKIGKDLLIEPLINEKNFYDWASSRAICGLVAIGKFPKEYNRTVKKLSIPTVLVDVFSPWADEFNTIRVDDTLGSFIATDYLIKNGHRKIGFISANINASKLDRRRYQGYREALWKNGVPFNSQWVFVSAATHEGGFEMAPRIMESGLSGLVCAADTLAIGIMQLYFMKGKSIPEDLSLVGFDDILTASLVVPGLTTVKQDIRAKGITASEMLTELMKNPEAKVSHLVLEPNLIERASVKKIQ